MDKWTVSGSFVNAKNSAGKITYFDSDGEPCSIAQCYGPKATEHAKLIALAPELVTALRELRTNEALDDDDARLIETRGKVDALLTRLES